jgi:hypothetical protein
MAIDRTAFNLWIDDDGSGTTGTVLTTERMAEYILDPIDAAIAAVGAVRTLTFVLSGGGSDIAAATQTVPVAVPFAGTLTSARVLSPQTGSLVLDVWKDTYANHPPTVADSITASAKPTLSGANKALDTTLTGWTTAIAAGDVFVVKVDSCSGIQSVSLQLTVEVA